MQIQLEAENLELTQEIKDYVQQKLGAVVKYLPQLDNRTDLVARVFLVRSSHHKKGAVFECRVRLAVPQKFVKVSEKGQTPEEAVDLAAEALFRKVRRYKTRWRDITRARLRQIKRRFKQSRLLR